MRIQTRITAVARGRGRTAAEVAKQLGLYRSNLSAMDAGRRSVSLRTLGRIAKALDCGLGDLLEIEWGRKGQVFRSEKLCKRLRARELAAREDGDRSWVHKALLAWQRHYRIRRRVK